MRPRPSLEADETLLGSVDSRYIVDGDNTFVIPLPQIYATVSHSLAFRLDSRLTGGAMATVDNAIFGCGGAAQTNGPGQ